MRSPGVVTQIHRPIPKGVLQPWEMLRSAQDLPLSKDRTIYSVSGCPSQARFLVHNHCLENLQRGLVERVFCVEREGRLVAAPQPVKRAFKKLEPFRQAVISGMGVAHQLSYDGFLSYYSGARLRMYTKAVESLHIQPVCREDAYLSTFVKAEKISTLKGDPAPRVIQPRSPRYNVELGRYLRHLEKKFMKAIDEVFGEPTCIKGYTNDEVGAIIKDKWERYKRPVGIGLDASRFDQHCSIDALTYEHGFYTGVHPHSKLLPLLLGWQLHNEGKGFTPNGRVKYKKLGCRMSGDINTSLGNYILMCSMVWGFMKELNINKYSLVNCGDDCVIITEHKYVKTIQKHLHDWFTRRGYTMKMENPVYELEEVEFCQARPITYGNGCKMVRNVRNAMGKDCHCVNNMRDLSTRKAWSTAQHKGGLSLSRGIPVVEMFYSRFKVYDNIGKHQPITTVTSMHKWAGSDTPCDITPEARYHFWKAFGLTGDEQIALEQRLKNWDMDFCEVDGTDHHVPSILDFAAA